ncbi:MAG: C-GCAxxG-C-C family protein [Prolixibacteraceae bacterium]|jgi:C_GCAxxG_C_C family probable redox protein|nr:C-GCAxxG-C-C family protein [Prolixibacteraceae bacterium]
MKRTEQAEKYFSNHFNCSQSVFAAFAPDLGLSVDDSLKVACAFGGGMARQQHTCGAVTGALMAIGLKYGKGINDNDDKKSQTYAKTVTFFEKFIEEHGSINCRELLDGLDMNNPADLERIQSEELFNKRCPHYVATATQIVEQMIDE